MIILVIYGAVGYLFFKYMLPMLRSNDPKTKPDEVYQFYGKHPKLLILTMMLALFGIFGAIETVTGIIGFIFLYCPNDGSSMISIQCWLKQNLWQ